MTNAPIVTVVEGLLPPSKLGIVLIRARRDAQLLVGTSVVTGTALTEVLLGWRGLKVYTILTLMENKR